MSRIGPRENLLTSGTAHPPTNRGRTWGYDALSQVFSAENDAQSRRVLRTTTAIAPPGSRHHPLPLRRLERHRRVFSSSLNTENFQLKTSLTWGVDLSGTLQGAVGVGGLLAVSDHRSPTTDHFFPTYDASRDSPYSPPLVPFVPAVHDYDTNLHAHKSLNLHRILPPAPTTQTATLYPCGDWINPSAPNSNCFANSQSKEYGFRYYEPLTGRWLNRDPIEEEGGINLYAFVGNDGVGRWDVLGLSEDSDKGRVKIRSFRVQFVTLMGTSTTLTDVDTFVKKYLLKDALKYADNKASSRFESYKALSRLIKIVSGAAKAGKAIGVVITEGASSAGLILDEINVRSHVEVVLCNKNTGEYEKHQISGRGTWVSGTHTISFRNRDIRRNWEMFTNAFESAVTGCASDIGNRIENLKNELGHE